MGLLPIKIQQSIPIQPKTAFIMLTLRIQPSFIHCCRLAQLYMDLQKDTCLETIQNLEFRLVYDHLSRINFYISSKDCKN